MRSQLLFRACGADQKYCRIRTKETVRIGKELSFGQRCYPLALTTGDMIKATRRPGFDPEKSAFFMPTGKGPCRFGQVPPLPPAGSRSSRAQSTWRSLLPMQDESLHNDVRAWTRISFS